MKRIRAADRTKKGALQGNISSAGGDASQAVNHKLVDRIESVYMNPTDYSPMK